MVLGLGMQGDVQGFVGQADLAAPVEDGVRGIEHNNLAAHQALLDLKRRRRAKQLDVAVATHKKLDDLAPVQAHELQQDVAEFTLAHQHGNVARGGAQHPGSRIAASRQVDLAADFSKAALGCLNGGEQPVQLNRAQVQSGFESSGFHIDIDPDTSGQGSTRHAQRNRVKLQNAVDQLDVHAAPVERQLFHMADISRAVGHIRIHGLEPHQVQRGRRQDLARCVGLVRFFEPCSGRS